jgi:hypothetical protein
MIDSVTYPADVPSGQSLARVADGAVEWRSDYPNSPGAPNLPATPTVTTTPTATFTATASATPTPEAQLLWVNELLAAPATGDVEWVELYNPGSTAVELTGWVLRRTSGSDVVREQELGAATVAPGGYVVYELPSSFLPNAGASLVLLDGQGREIDSGLSYPALTTGQVYARETDGSATWREDYPASPGAANQPPAATATPTSNATVSPTALSGSNQASDSTATATPEAQLLQVNELLAAPATGDVEWVELYNPGSTAVELAGWVLRRTSGSDVVREQELGAATVAPGGYVVYELPSSFLPNAGASLVLLDGQGREIDSGLSYPALTTGQVYARETDGGATWRDDYPASPGAANQPPAATATPTSTGAPDSPHATATQPVTADTATATSTRTHTPTTQPTARQRTSTTTPEAAADTSSSEQLTEPDVARPAQSEPVPVPTIATTAVTEARAPATSDTPATNNPVTLAAYVPGVLPAPANTPTSLSGVAVPRSSPLLPASARMTDADQARRYQGVEGQQYTYRLPPAATAMPMLPTSTPVSRMSPLRDIESDTSTAPDRLPILYIGLALVVSGGGVCFIGWRRSRSI